MNRKNGFDRLNLDYDLVINEKIQTVPAVNTYRAVAHGLMDLLLDTKSAASKPAGHALLVDVLQ